MDEISAAVVCVVCGLIFFFLGAWVGSDITKKSFKEFAVEQGFAVREVAEPNDTHTTWRWKELSEVCEACE